MYDVFIKKGRERSLVRRHRWIFSGAIDRIDGSPQPGEIVRVCDAAGKPLAVGYYNSASKIQVRVLDWNPDAELNTTWWRQRIEAALRLRSELPGMETGSQRLIFSEADGLPGLIVDRYGGVVVVQALTAGIERAKADIVAIIEDLLQPKSIYERSDGEPRLLEGLSPINRQLAGAAVDEPVMIRENVLKFLVDVKHGHKTGFYIDQRSNRRRIAGYATGRQVLDLFSYTGAFACYAALAGAERVTLVDSSADAFQLAQRNVELNNVADRCDFVAGNAFEVVRQMYKDDRRFGLVVCDPPKLCPSKAQLPKAERAYKDINMNALKLIEPGGFLVTFSCSAAVDYPVFSKILAWAALDAGREIRIVERLSQGRDHPVDPCFPESDYLTGFICRVE